MNKDLFKNKNFTLLMMGILISNKGNILQQFALSLYVLQKTGSGVLFASVVSIAIIPQLVLGPFIGVFIDRWNRKKVIIISDFLAGILVFAAALVMHFYGELGITHIYILTILLSCINLFFTPAMASMIPMTVEKSYLSDANSIKSFILSLTSITGPLLGGIMYAYLGLNSILIINAISFILSGISEMFIHINIPVANDHKSNSKYFSELRDGFAFLNQNPILNNLLVVTCIANFALAALVRVIMPFTVIQIMNGSEEQFGLFSGIVMIGAVLAPFILYKYLSNDDDLRLLVRTLKWMSILVVLMLVNTLFYSGFVNLEQYGSPLLWIYTLLSLLLFVVIGIHNIKVSVLFQTKVPQNMLGRIGSIFTTVTLIAAPLGQMLFGVFLDHKYGTASLLVIIIITRFAASLLSKTEQDRHVNTSSQTGI